MNYRAVIVADSAAQGVRLTTLEVTFPRYVLAELNTHRVFSRNSASSRAIPVKIRVQQVRESPFVPEFTRNKGGMQADEILVNDSARNATAFWLGASKMAADMAESLSHIEVHKQQANRVLEPYAWHTALITATEWDNFFALRMHKDAAPEIRRAAEEMFKAMEGSTPRPLEVGEWHLPYIEPSETGRADATLRMISVARCAAVSYERQHAQKPVDEYVKRHDALKSSGHWSPFEHQAKVASFDEITKHASFRVEGGNFSMASDGTIAATGVRMTPTFIGNFAVPWLQYRKMIPGEQVFRP